jgi:hypothetical protein
MADGWIKMRTDLPEDPSVLALAEALSIDVDSVIGKLLRFWSWTDKHTKDGRLPNVKTSWIDAHVRCDGFAKALNDVQWLRENGAAGVTLPNFKKHNGESAKARADAALRQRRKRHNDVTKPRDKSVTREEKRREEKRRVNPDGNSSSNSTVERKSNYVPAFERWWISYPKKVGKHEASKAYARAGGRIVSGGNLSREEAAGKLQASCELFAKSDAGRGEYCPNPATWLNRGSYDDDPAAWKNRTTSAVEPTTKTTSAAEIEETMRRKQAEQEARR